MIELISLCLKLVSAVVDTVTAKPEYLTPEVVAELAKLQLAASVLDKKDADEWGRVGGTGR